NSLRHRDQPAHDSDFARRAISGHVSLQAGPGEWLARGRVVEIAHRSRHAGSGPQLPASRSYRNLSVGRGVLSALLLPGSKNRVDRRGDGAQPRDDEAAPAGRAGVLQVLARTRGCALKHLVVTADDFGLAPEVNAAVELAHQQGILTAASLMVTGAAAADAGARGRRLPSLRGGLHLGLLDGHALPPPRGGAAL